MKFPGIQAALEAELQRRHDLGLSTDIREAKMDLKLYTYDTLGLVAHFIFEWPNGPAFVHETTEANLFLAEALAANGMLGRAPDQAELH